ncbi:MAG: hypothetical protein U5K43_03485 [Halofilum sp. (in: g-proteobacteria)]|nr:hypothetical protein [Halofilum sp. (in: g-proteobacteria)]
MQRHLAALQAERVAAAVEALVVQLDDLPGLARDVAGRLDDLEAVLGVALHDRPLLRGEAATLVQDLGRRLRHAHVAEQRAHREALELGALEAEVHPERQHQHADVDRVAGGVLVALTQVGEPQRGGRVARYDRGQLADDIACAGGIEAATRLHARHGVIEEIERRAAARARLRDQLAEGLRVRLPVATEHVGDVLALAARAPLPRLVRRRGLRLRLERPHRVLARARRVDVHVGAVAAQDVELLVVADLEALEHERDLGPGPVELGHVEALAQLADDDADEGGRAAHGGDRAHRLSASGLDRIATQGVTRRNVACTGWLTPRPPGRTRWPRSR